MQIQGSRVLITGASRGIGESIARALHAAGATVALAARNEASLRAVSTALGSRTSIHPIDLSEPTQLNGWIDNVEHEIGGPIDILVNNAGIDLVGSFATRSASDVHRIHQVNLLSPIELCRQVLPAMLERGGGHLVNVSSTAATGAFSGLAMYGSTKAGLSNFTRILRHEIQGSGVQTTVVSLGPVLTDMLDEVNAFEPTRKSFDRMRRLQLMPNIKREAVAKQVVSAIAKNKAHVRMPRRAAMYPALAEVPQTLVNLVLKGIDRGYRP